MNGFLFLLLNGSLTECKNRASRVCVCTTKQSADIGNDGYGIVQYNWLTLVESALADMGWCTVKAIKVYPMKEPITGESDKHVYNVHCSKCIL